MKYHRNPMKFSENFQIVSNFILYFKIYFPFCVIWNTWRFSNVRKREERVAEVYFWKLAPTGVLIRCRCVCVWTSLLIKPHNYTKTTNDNQFLKQTTEIFVCNKRHLTGIRDISVIVERRFKCFVLQMEIRLRSKYTHSFFYALFVQFNQPETIQKIIIII